MDATNSSDSIQQYHDWYRKLWFLINSAVKDRYVLQLLEVSEKKIQSGSETNAMLPLSLIEHIAETTKQHFGLAMCKLYFDDGSEGNLQHFNAFIQTSLKSFNPSKVSFSTMNKYDSIKNNLIELRKKYYAHLDVKDANVSIKVSDLGDALHDLIHIFNQLCLQDIDNEITPYSMEQLWLSGFKTSYELALILKGD